MKTRLFILSFGTGGTNYLTQEAIHALQQSVVVVSYSKYARELNSLLEDKKILSSGMIHENERCLQAIESALSGKSTAILSNGDANVFGISTFILQEIEKKNLWDKIEVISIAGITSFLALASKAGAFIGDIALLNFSTKFNEIATIKKRFEVCMQNDFTIGIYNPKSKKKTVVFDYFLNALKHFEERKVIIGSSIGREKEKITVTTTTKLIQEGNENPLIGMATLLIVCSSSTVLTQNGLVISS
ncbi:MAG: precorrin-3B C(17)-methyltransferase [Arcobacteraceae bacterium]